MGIIGAFVVLGCVFGGYMLAGGHMHIIWQPFEFMIIFGAALGGLISANTSHTVKAVFKGAIRVMTGAGAHSKKDYLELCSMLFKFFQVFRRDGPQAVEKHVEAPNESEIFKANPSFLKNHHAVHFLCDTMKIVLSSDLSQYDIDDLLDQDIKTMHEEEHHAAHALQSVADAMPGLGIVAAVLGVVHTMGILDQGTEAIGHSVAAALVGTFMGVLMCYGFLAPFAGKMNLDVGADGQYLKVIKAALVALQRGNPPLVCVEYARRTIYPEERPSFEEVDKASKEKKAA